MVGDRVIVTPFRELWERHLDNCAYGQTHSPLSDSLPPENFRRKLGSGYT